MGDLAACKNAKIVWITLINYGYIHFAKNFLQSAVPLDFQLVVYCLDIYTYMELQGTPKCICIMADFVKDLPSELKVWGEAEYENIVFAKLDAIRYTLQETYDLGVKAVGYIDTDIFLFSDPSPHFLDEMQLYQDIDIFSQCGEENMECSHRFFCPMLCSGVFVVRNKKNLYGLFEYTANDIPTFSGDQQFLVHKIKEKGLPHRTMPTSIMPNGSYYRLDEKVTFPPETCLIHFNYLVGSRKELLMRHQGLWLL
uniref:Nucleotide-diphospho-sugar transferase domain-containing protein n=1 Tax=viral metagenome TaxID=1070528 RepID=A0A6C0L7H8_9ZZZZ